MAEFPSCEQKPPLIKLDPEGQSELFYYNLRQSTCFDAKGYIRLGIPNTCFKQQTFTPPKENFWDLVVDLPESEIYQRINDDLVNNSVRPFILNNSYLYRLPITKADEGNSKVEKRATTIQPKEKAEITNIDVSQIVNQIVKGKRPILRKNFFGRPYFQFVSKPANPEPRISFVFHYKVCSYLGHVGAGKVVKTFSLLPGEKTVISVRSFMSRTDLRSRAENVLDSFSESSANELQTILENETSVDATTTTNSNSTSEVGGGLQVGLNLGFVNIGAGGGGGTTNASTVSNTAATHVGSISSALDTHVDQSSSNRQIEINTESSSAVTTEDESSTIREISNINLDRVLNFIFRQVNQEYLTITYLDQVSLVYTNGYSESRKLVELSDIDGLLKEVLNEACVDDARKYIYASLCSLYDYTGTKVSFIEKVTEEITDCIGGGGVLFTNEYVRKKPNLSQTYQGITVPGIIIDVKSRVLPTSSVVSEAMLGQGDALDCYNQKLQGAATVEAALNNDALYQQMQIINGISDPEKKAKLYKKVFGTCCDVAQSGGCCNCNEEPVPPVE